MVDYSKKSELRFALAGVDTVISTISGAAQIALIDAAAAAHVRRFVPSEFEGSPAARTTERSVRQWPPPGYHAIGTT